MADRRMGVPRTLEPSQSGADTILVKRGNTVTVDHTPSGTPVIELDEREYAEFLASEVRRGSGLTVEEFVRRYEAGELDESDPDVSDLAGLLWLGQNGHRAAA